jgi:hypothetical protein
VTAAAGATAGYFMLHTRSLHDDFTSAGCSAAPASGCDTKKSDGESAEATANITLGVTAGLAVLVTVVGVAFTDWKRCAPRPRAERVARRRRRDLFASLLSA